MSAAMASSDQGCMQVPVPSSSSASFAASGTASPPCDLVMSARQNASPFPFAIRCRLTKTFFGVPRKCSRCDRLIVLTAGFACQFCSFRCHRRCNALSEGGANVNDVQGRPQLCSLSRLPENDQDVFSKLLRENEINRNDVDICPEQWTPFARSPDGSVFGDVRSNPEEHSTSLFYGSSQRDSIETLTSADEPHSPAPTTDLPDCAPGADPLQRQHSYRPPGTPHHSRNPPSRATLQVVNSIQRPTSLEDGDDDEQDEARRTATVGHRQRVLVTQATLAAAGAHAEQPAASVVDRLMRLWPWAGGAHEPAAQLQPTCGQGSGSGSDRSRPSSRAALVRTPVDEFNFAMLEKFFHKNSTASSTGVASSQADSAISSCTDPHGGSCDGRNSARQRRLQWASYVAGDRGAHSQDSATAKPACALEADDDRVSGRTVTPMCSARSVVACAECARSHMANDTYTQLASESYKRLSASWPLEGLHLNHEHAADSQYQLATSVCDVSSGSSDSERRHSWTLANAAGCSSETTTIASTGTLAQPGTAAHPSTSNGAFDAAANIAAGIFGRLAWRREPDHDALTSQDSREPDAHSLHERDSFRDLAEWSINYGDVTLDERIQRGRLVSAYRGRWHGDVLVHVYEPGQLERFLRDVHTLTKVRHDNIALFMGACMEPPNLAVLTSIRRGDCLYDLIHLKHRRMPLQHKICIARQVAQGMGYLHAKNIVLRCLNSRAVYLDAAHSASKVVKAKISMVDYGGPRHHVQRRALLARQQLAYMSAELVRTLRLDKPLLRVDNRLQTKAADIYAFGTLLYELQSGTYPLSELPIQAHIWLSGSGGTQSLDKLKCPQQLKVLMQECWATETHARTTFAAILAGLQQAVYSDDITLYIFPEETLHHDAITLSAAAVDSSKTHSTSDPEQLHRCGTTLGGGGAAAGLMGHSHHGGAALGGGPRLVSAFHHTAAQQHALAPLRAFHRV